MSFVGGGFSRHVTRSQYRALAPEGLPLTLSRSVETLLATFFQSLIRLTKLSVLLSRLCRLICGSEFPPFLAGPARLIHLAAARDTQPIRRHIFRDC
jgi:hypothetical protein